jgi:uncharacterized membrane protein YoaK (UPF0700 family)
MDRQTNRSQPPVSLAEPTTRMLLALTFVTGIVDAVSFLGLGQVFALLAILLGALTSALLLKESLRLPIFAAALVTLTVLPAHASLKRS